MMRTRFQSKKLAIQHMGKRRQRMPVLEMNVRERPGDILPAQAGLDLMVLTDVARIVITDESISQRLTENGPGDRNQCGADNDFRRYSRLHNCVELRPSRLTRKHLVDLSRSGVGWSII